MGAALKSHEAADLSGLAEAELLKVLGEAVRITTASPTARAVYDRLLVMFAKRDIGDTMKMSRWQEDKKGGPKAIAAISRQMKAAWEAHLKEKLIEAHGRQESLIRADLVSLLKSYSFGRYTGKKGTNIQDSTIRRWLTTEVEGRIRAEAVTLFKAR